MDQKSVEALIAYRLRRWLRTRRSPDDARAGARKIVQQLKISGISFIRRVEKDTPSTP